MARLCVGILSVGDMGAGVARLLKANGYRVVTNAADRSQPTQDRAVKAGAELLASDTELCRSADYILSIVPPEHAMSTAERVVTASSSRGGSIRQGLLHFLDLNAVSPRSAREIRDLFDGSAPEVRFIDGGIIGGPPRAVQDGSWSCPSIVTSGPHSLFESGSDASRLAQTLNMRHVSEVVGAASGLKMCFASLTKGFTAIAIQSFTTAHELGMLDELQQHLETHASHLGQVANRSVTTMAPKAYRWVREMREISETFKEDGGFSEDQCIFSGVSATYALVAHGTTLGQEKTESRVRGKTVDDVAELMTDGLRRPGRGDE